MSITITTWNVQNQRRSDPIFADKLNFLDSRGFTNASARISNPPVAGSNPAGRASRSTRFAGKLRCEDVRRDPRVGLFTATVLQPAVIGDVSLPSPYDESH